MLTEAQREALVAFADDELGWGVSESDVVATRDTVEDFLAACLSWRSRQDLKMADGTPIVVLKETQRQKREPRCDLAIADFGDARGVIAC